MIYFIITVILFPALTVWFSTDFLYQRVHGLVNLLVSITLGIGMFIAALQSHLFIEEETIKRIESKQYTIIRTYTIEQGDTIATRFKLKSINK